MRNIKYILFLWLIISCSKDDILEPTPPPPPVLCEVDYSTLQSGINRTSTHYQPSNEVFIDYASMLNVTLSKFGSYGIFSAGGDFNHNSINDYVMVVTDGDNPSNNEVIIVVDNEISLAFASPQVGTRKVSVIDLNQDSYDDIILFGTGPDIGDSPGDKTHVIYLTPNNYTVKEVGLISGYHHTGAVGAIEGTLPDILDIDAQAAFTIGATEKVKYYVNNGSIDGWIQKDTNIPYYLVSSTYQSELYDINKDGILDLILGGHEWAETWYDSSPTPPQWRTHILLGLGNGQFDISNPILLPIIENWGVLTDIDVYDIDNDSNLEIIITRTTGRQMEEYQPWPETFYDGHIIQILKEDNADWYNWQIIEQPSQIFTDQNIHIEWPYVTKIYDVNKDCLLDIVPESDKLNAKSFSSLNNIRGLYYEQQEDNTFKIKYKK